MAGEFWLDDRQWVRLQPMLPNKPRGIPRVDDRRVISGIVHVLQSGCRWKDAASIYGLPKTLYKSRNAIERMFCRLKDCRRPATRYDKLAANFLGNIHLAAAIMWWLCVSALVRQPHGG
jgi:transposase